MQIVTGSSEIEMAPCALALGNFDGVHAGHQAVLQTTIEIAAAQNIEAAVAVFDPHPRRFFQPDSPPFRLMDDTQQAEALRAMGFARLHVLPFNQNVSQMMPREFAETILCGWANTRQVIVGIDFEFGKGRSGDVASLKGIGEQLGFVATGVGLKADGTEKISSSQIRQHLSTGDIENANRLLGRCWAVRGVVEQGDQRGRTIGFPTANISLGAYCRPKFGVYAVRVQVNDQTFGGVANVGVRPTVNGSVERLEVHIFDFSADIYGENVDVQFEAFLRPEQKFNGLDALKAQILEDARTARAILSTSR
jgi:riboflavin kinase/FMN adenylyltransferase